MTDIEIIMSKANNQTTAKGDIYQIVLDEKSKEVKTDIVVRQSGNAHIGKLSQGKYYYRFEITGIGGEYTLSAQEVSNSMVLQEEDFDTAETGFIRQIFKFEVEK